VQAATAARPPLHHAHAPVPVAATSNSCDWFKSDDAEALRPVEEALNGASASVRNPPKPGVPLDPSLDMEGNLLFFMDRFMGSEIL
jgi:hypothetical protein